MHHSLFFFGSPHYDTIKRLFRGGALKVLTSFSVKALISVRCQWASWCGGSLKRPNKGSKNSVFRRTACCKSIQADVKKIWTFCSGLLYLQLKQKTVLPTQHEKALHPLSTDTQEVEEKKESSKLSLSQNSPLGRKRSFPLFFTISQFWHNGESLQR